MKKNRNKGDLIFGISLTVCTVLIFGSLFIFKDKIFKEGNIFTYMSDNVDVVDLKDQPMLGNKDATITIVEYGDYNCPACGYFSSVILPLLEPEYIDSGLINFVYKDFPFKSEDSLMAAIYAEGVRNILGNEAYWMFNKKIFNTQFVNNESQSPKSIVLDKATLNEIANELFGEEDTKKLKGVLDNQEYIDAVLADREEAKDININSTPTLLINGKKVLNSLSYESVNAAIAEEMQLLDKSTKEETNEEN